MGIAAGGGGVLKVSPGGGGVFQVDLASLHDRSVFSGVSGGSRGAGACHHSILSSIHAGVVQGVQGGPGLVPVLHEGGGGELSALQSSLQGQQLVGAG